MPLTIPDRVVNDLRAQAPSALVELACRLYAADSISKPEATKLAGLARADFEAELTRRGLPWIRLDYDDTYEQEFAELREDLSPQAGRGGG
jgi:predicted HTH domain antitoxin